MEDHAGIALLDPHVEASKNTPASAPQWRDLPFAVLFVLQLFFVVALFFWGAFSPVPAVSDDFFVWLASLPNSQLLAYGGVVCTVAATATAWALFARSLIMLAPRAMIYVGLVCSLLLTVAALCAAIAARFVFGIVLFALFAALQLFNIFVIGDLVDFTEVLLAYVANVFREHPSVLVLSSAVFLVQMMFSLFWCLTLSYSQRIPQLQGAGSLVFLVFSFYWSQLVLQNFHHTAVAGLFAEIYFHGERRVQAPLFASARRAATFAFGSICFGSLIVAIFRTIRSLLRSRRNERVGDAFVECIVGCMEALARWFNTYAFSYIAIYGESYLKSAYRSYNLLMESGCMAMINDSLVRGVLVSCCLAGGIVGCGVSVLMSFLLGLTYDAHAAAPFVAGTLGFLVGGSFTLVFLEPIESGVTCTYVCLAEAPQRMEVVRPALFEAVGKKYPDVLKAVP